MRDKMANTEYILKKVEKDPFLSLQIKAKEDFNNPQFFPQISNNVKIKLMENETNCWSIFR